MYVSQLRSVPVGQYAYYCYLVDASAKQVHSKAVDRFFDAFARQSEVDAVIVRGPDDLSWQLFEFLRMHAHADFPRLERLFQGATCLVISEGALQTTKKPVHAIPLMVASANESDQSQLADELLSALLKALKEHQLSNFVRELGAERIDLSEIKGGMLVATLRHLNEWLELKPNVAGIGLNLNAAIQSALGPSERPIPE